MARHTEIMNVAYNLIVDSDVIERFDGDNGERKIVIHHIYYKPDIKSVDISDEEKLAVLKDYISSNFNITRCQHSYDCCGRYYRQYAPDVMFNDIYIEAVVKDTLYLNI